LAAVRENVHQSDQVFSLSVKAPDWTDHTAKQIAKMKAKATLRFF
jgi:hypothetical protein